MRKMNSAIAFNAQDRRELSATAATGTQESPTQKVIARWDNEGGAGPDGPQESHASPVANGITTGSGIGHGWSQTLGGGEQVLIRPLSKLDASAHRDFFDGLSTATKRLRFLGLINQPSEALIAQLTDVDGKDKVALVAVMKEGATETILGVCRYSKLGDVKHCESALVVSDEWQHKGLGTALMQHLIEIARTQGLASMESTEFAENSDMLTLMRKLGFQVKTDPRDATLVTYTLDLLAAV